MTWHEGICSICGQIKQVGRVECIEEDMCAICFDEVNAMMPYAQHIVDTIIKPQIMKVLKDERNIAVAQLN